MYRRTWIILPLFIVWESAVRQVDTKKRCAIGVREKALYNLLPQKCDRILQSKHCFTFDIFQIHPEQTNTISHYKFSLQMPKLRTDRSTEGLESLPKEHFVSILLDAFKPFQTPDSCPTSPAFKTQSCCFQPVSFTTEGKVIEFCLLNRGSLDWIKICGARGYSAGEWRPIMALKRETCIINHSFLSYPWRVRQGNPCLSEHRQ